MKPIHTLEPRSATRTGASVRAAADSHPGLQRDHNEDRFHYDLARGIFLVVDGVGGHAAGEKAADLAVTVLRERLERETGSIEDRIREAIALANNNIHRLASWKPEWRGMGCVLTVAVVTNGHAVVGHVGDTRLYKLRAGRLEKITKDHSPVGEREDAHELSEAEAMRHPRRNEVYRDVGSEPHEPGDAGFVDILTVPFEADSALLLCSDGLTDTVPSGTINDIVRAYAGHPYEVVRILIDAANKAGGKDNITVVYLEGNEFTHWPARPGAAVRDLLATPPSGVPPAGQPASPASPALKAAPSRMSWPGAVLDTLLVLAVVASMLLQANRWRGVSLPALPLTTNAYEVRVRPDESIAAAITSAAPGSTVIVEPGEYREQVRLKSGVRVRSRVPREASIRLRRDAAESDPAVLAIDVTGAELSGFRILGDAATPLGTGIHVRNAEVTLSDVEITGAAVSALEIVSGAEASIVAADIHDNPGAGLVIRGAASPRIVHSEFARNGGAERKAPAIVIEAGATPRLAGNVFHGIGPEILTGLSRGDREKIGQTNVFIAGSRGRTRPVSPERRVPEGRP